MTGSRTRRESIKNFIVENVEQYTTDIACVVAREFDITRQTANRHLKRLVDDKLLIRSGNTRSRTYLLNESDSLQTDMEWVKSYKITPGLDEDVVWRNDVAHSLKSLPDSVISIWHIGFTEIFNNVIDHSGGDTVTIRFHKTANVTEIIISDNGVGIFKKVQNELGLLDERHAILELVKGKSTTDPENHTGEGIFFTSKIFEGFDISSADTCFSYHYEEGGDRLLKGEYTTGTSVRMKLGNHMVRTTEEIFAQYISDDEFEFNKTVVPVRLAQYGDNKLISRSQAKRLLSRVDRFKTVIFDFQSVDVVGQAFADEIFRVFVLKHPDVELIPVKANSTVKAMINRAWNEPAHHNCNSPA